MSSNSSSCNVPSDNSKNALTAVPFPPNPKILSMIMRNLGTRDLLKCRLVNSKWSSVATQTLLQRNELWIRFKYSKRNQSYYREEAKLSTTKSLKILTTLIRTTVSSSRSFPCTNFQFKDGSLDSREVQIFIAIVGPKMTGLIIKGSALTFDMQVRNFGKLLTEQAPNISFLELPFPKSWTQTNMPLIIPQNAKLPKLKTAQLIYDEYCVSWERIAKELKRAAVNIQAFRTRRNVKFWSPETPEQQRLFDAAKEDITCYLTVNKEGVKARKAYGRMAEDMETEIDFVKMGFKTFGELLYHMDDILIVQANEWDDHFLFLRDGADGEDLAHITNLVQKTPNSNKRYKGFKATLRNTRYTPLESLLTIKYDLTIPEVVQKPSRKRKRGFNGVGKALMGMIRC